jgi:nitric oxide reductase subunit C
MKIGPLMKILLTLFTDCLLVVMLSLVIVAEAWPQTESDRISRGKQIYSEKRCALCHMIQAKGGKSGPDLSDVGTKRDAEWLERFLITPGAVVPNAKMPSFKGSVDEREALIAYLLSLK